MKYACIGEHLKHSFSKEIHAKLADYDYDIKEIPRDKLVGFMKNADFSGINVTIPYKELVIPYLDEIDADAEKIGAVNTVVNRCGKLCGYNTDFYGMRELFIHAEINPFNKKAAILGTGGTSKCARSVLENLGAKEILTVSRTKKTGCVTYDELYEKHYNTELIINTTPVGMYPDINKSPIDVSRFKRLFGVIDAVYNPIRTELVSSAKALGIKAEGGLYMLVAQAKRASELFLDVTYSQNKQNEIFEEISASKENIVLIGMPGSGKSTLGSLLSEITNRDFFDTDSLIVQNEGMEISEIFKIFGEAKFREYEKKTIASISDKTSLVIATGGGSVLDPENVKALKKNGKLVFLNRDPEAIIPTSTRPLALDKEAIMKRYSERLPVYKACADITINVSGEPKALAEKIKEMLNI